MKKLNSCPTDSISCIRFDSSSKYLLTSSWDSNLYLYNIQEDTCSQSYKSRGPVLSCDFTSDATACSGGLDCDIKWYDLQTMTDNVIGKHDNAVSCVRWSQSRNCICSGSWDGTIGLWDPLLNPKESAASMAFPRTSLPSIKIYALDVLDKCILFAATNTLRVLLYDLRNFGQPIEVRHSQHKYNLRSICALPATNGFAVSSIEGRVRIDCINSTDKALQYSFRCHRKQINDQPVIYAVNAIAGHPKETQIATGGSDRSFCLWDYKTKRSLFIHRDLPDSVSSIAFNSDGTMLGVATSNLYENGKPQSNE